MVTVRLNDRLNRLERQLPGPEVQQRVFLWVMFDGDVPGWAMAAIRPHLPTNSSVPIVQWSRCPSTGELSAVVSGQRYAVTSDGCAPSG